MGALAQTKLTRSYPVKSGDKLELSFDYPQVVRISTWDKNEVSVTAMVNINDGESDTAFKLEDQTADGVLTISNKISDMKHLPHRYTVIDASGKKSMFRTRELFDEYTSTHGHGNRMTSDGVDMEITIEIKVPVNISTNVKATYGIVELVNFNAPATVNAPYGGIDATVVQANTGKLQATTHYGQILSNLDLTLTDKTDKDFFTSITAEPGKGPAYILNSTYGKIYLRKP